MSCPTTTHTKSFAKTYNTGDLIWISSGEYDYFTELRCTVLKPFTRMELWTLIRKAGITECNDAIEYMLNEGYVELSDEGERWYLGGTKLLKPFEDGDREEDMSDYAER